MGDTFGDGYENEKPVHEVCVDDFYLGKYPVTQGQWKKVMGSNPSHFKSGDNYPVESVSWNDVQEFIKKLNQLSGQQYRLPTESEWEYAARSGGKRGKYAGTSSDSELGEYAWYDSNSGGKTHPVGQKLPNGLGLYDMSGNVWEWVEDTYSSNAYQSHSRTNPIYTRQGSSRVRRGGSWNNNPRNVRCSNRNNNPGNRNNNLGFRLLSTGENGRTSGVHGMPGQSIFLSQHLSGTALMPSKINWVSRAGRLTEIEGPAYSYY